MNFLPDVYVDCEVCHGKRYNRETLEVTYNGKTVADILNMPIEEAADFFKAYTGISRYLKTLVDVRKLLLVLQGLVDKGNTVDRKSTRLNSSH